MRFGRPLRGRVGGSCGTPARLRPCYASSVELPDVTNVFPWVEQLGFGGVAGFVAGYAMKKVGKFVAFALGLLFVALQLLAWFGYVNVNWGAVQESVDPLLTSESVQGAWQWVVHALTYNVPFAVAFVPAFVWGLKRG